MIGYIYCHPDRNYITKIFNCPRLDFWTAGVLVDPRTFWSIHIRDRIVILSTLLMTSIEYGGPNIDPQHLVLLMELPVIPVIVPSACTYWTSILGLCPPCQHNNPVMHLNSSTLHYYAVTPIPCQWFLSVTVLPGYCQKWVNDRTEMAASFYNVASECEPPFSVLHIPLHTHTKCLPNISYVWCSL